MKSMNRKKGKISEDLVADFLRDRGFEVVEQNFTIRGGEIDIIAKKESILHFVEVKSGDGFEAIYNLTPLKLQRVIKTAQRYMKIKKINEIYSIDAAIVQNKKIEFLENVTV